MPSSLTALALTVLVVAAGVSVALQQAVNAQLRSMLGSPWWAGAASYAGGLAAMLAAVLAAALAGGAARPSVALAARVPWYGWTGGLLGAFYIATGIFTVPRLGAAPVLALFVVGQLLGAVVVDHFGLLGVPAHPAGPVRLGGAVLLLIGAILIRR